MYLLFPDNMLLNSSCFLYHTNLDYSFDISQCQNLLENPIYYNFYFDFRTLNQSDINSRCKIISTLMSHTGLFLNSLFQSGEFNSNKSLYSNKYFTVVTSHDGVNCFGSWWAKVRVNNAVIMTGFTDVIALYAIFKKKSYKDSINELIAYIESSGSLFRKNNETPAWYIQEKNPVNIIGCHKRDHFLSTIKMNNILNCFDFRNKNGNIFAEQVIFFNTQNEEVSVFYAYLRRHDSPKLYYVNCLQTRPYMICSNCNDETSRCSYIHKDFNSFFLKNYSNCCNYFISMGYSSLHDVEFSELKTKRVVIEFDIKRLSSNTLLQLKKSEAKYDKKILFHDQNRAKCYGIDNLLKIFYNLDQSKDKEKLNFLNKPIPPGEIFPNQNKIRKKILDPIIESGTITWLFAQEKVGKTVVALSIAYIVAKGNISLGDWRSGDPLDVLYVDGEMPGDKLSTICDRIMRGFGEIGDNIYRPFHTYLFREQSPDYVSLLDENFLKFNVKMFSGYDLIIFDNYYTLNENSINVKPFVAFVNMIIRKSNAAVIVVDHTNSLNELQGSIVKRRAMDLGIQLDVVGDDTISVNYCYDRYGVGNNLSNTHLVKRFNSLEYHFDVVKSGVGSNQSVLSKDELYCLFFYILHKVLNIKQVEISSLFKLTTQRISEYVISAKCFVDNTDHGKHKIINKIKFKRELDRLSLLSKEDLLKQFSKMKESLNLN